MGKGLASEKHKRAIEERRELVSSLVRRKLTIRRICAELEAAGYVNPATGKAWSHNAIHEDITALKEEWRQNAQANIEQHFADLLAEYEEVKSAGWQAGNLSAVLKAMDSQREMFGFKSMTTDYDWRKELEAAGVKASDVFEQLVNQIAEHIGGE